jgi:hypothetical protein
MMLRSLTLVSVRMDTPATPVVVQLRADAVSGHGAATAVSMPFELGG